MERHNGTTGRKAQRAQGQCLQVNRVLPSLNLYRSVEKKLIPSVAFSPDGKSLVSGSLDRTLRVWDLSGTKRAVESQMPGSKENVEKGLGTCQSTLNGHKVCQSSIRSSNQHPNHVYIPHHVSLRFLNTSTLFNSLIF